MKTDLVREAISAADMRFALVVSRWNASFTMRLETGALAALGAADAGDDRVEILRVPGAFELSLVCLEAAKSGRFDAVIALGVVIRGDTPHFDYIAAQTAAGLMQASLITRVPVLFGVITADNVAQTEARCGEGADNKGYEAAQSAIEMVDTLRKLSAKNDEVFEAKLKSLNVA